jgi:hypothetical protein
MGFLQNTWVRYYDRSYQQIKDRVITALQFRVPEITDHTSSNIFIKMVDIWAAIAEQLGYYIDNAAREAHLDSCRLYSSGISHARSADYRVKGRLAANGSVTFTLSGVSANPYIIPYGTLVKSIDTGIIYTTVNTLTIPAGELSGTVDVLQHEAVNGAIIGLSTGAVDQEIVVNEKMVDNTLILRVAGVLWTPVDTFAFSKPTDLHYLQTVSKTGFGVVIFGDGINGKIPEAGASLTGDYKITEGDLGSTDVGTVNTIVSELVLPDGLTLTVNNTNRIVGGANVETLDKIKSSVPKFKRTLDRAVTEQDYIDVAELAAGVNKAGLLFSCGKTIDIFIVPEGGGLASNVLINATQEYFRKKKMITTNPVIKPAGELRTKLKIFINANPQFRNEDVANTVKAALLDFISFKFQDIKGELHLSDIYYLVEKEDGVKNSRIVTMTPIPYARPLDENVLQLAWTPTVKVGSVATIVWKIIFVTVNRFQVLKNNGYLGEFEVGSQVTQPELNFTINQNYTSGLSWEFYSYPFFGTILLQEPSIPVSYDEDIELVVTGGLI